jgi:hypothetical protein
VVGNALGAVGLQLLEGAGAGGAGAQGAGGGVASGGDAAVAGEQEGQEHKKSSADIGRGCMW